jgi:hypothetical protein
MATGYQILSAGVYVTDDVGVEITDGQAVRARLGLLQNGNYGLQVIAADGATVIIDGTSDVFKIVATGTLGTSGAGTGTAQGAVTLTTGLGVIPVCSVWQEFLDTATSQNAGEAGSSLIINLTSGAIAFLYEGWAEATAVAGQTRVVAQTTATPVGAGGRSGTYRYYLMQEVAF